MNDEECCLPNHDTFLFGTGKIHYCQSWERRPFGMIDTFVQLQQKPNWVFLLTDDFTRGLITKLWPLKAIQTYLHHRQTIAKVNVTQLRLKLGDTNTTHVTIKSGTRIRHRVGVKRRVRRTSPK